MSNLDMIGPKINPKALDKEIGFWGFWLWAKAKAWPQVRPQVLRPSMF